MSNDFEDTGNPEPWLNGVAHKLRERKVLERLAELAAVPDKSGYWLKDTLFEIICEAWVSEHDRQAEKKITSNSSPLHRAIKALRSAKEALADLDKPLRKKLQYPISEIEGGIDRFFEWTVGAPETAQAREHTRGRRPGTIGDRPFQAFICKLLQAAKSAGGSFTLDKNAKSGTLIRALDVLADADALPQNFIPKALPMTTLERIKTCVNKKSTRWIKK